MMWLEPRKRAERTDQIIPSSQYRRRKPQHPRNAALAANAWSQGLRLPQMHPTALYRFVAAKQASLCPTAPRCPPCILPYYPRVSLLGVSLLLRMMEALEFNFQPSELPNTKRSF
jgi:hypothetical protein